MHDVMSNFSTLTVQISDHGFVRLVDCMPRLVPDQRQTADYAVAEAARVGKEGTSDDRTLIRYMMRNRHTSPFEMVEFKFHAKMPIFVARQWIRHRTANVNEVTARVSKVELNEFFVPTVDQVRQQSAMNKQGSNDAAKADLAATFIHELAHSSERALDAYEAVLNAGITGEQARMLIPLNFYTEWYWKIDLHNLLHFLALRCDSHAQAELRAYANAMLALITPIVPECVGAWETYHPMRGAMTLTALEVWAMYNRTHELDAGATAREKREWEEKKKRLGF